MSYDITTRFFHWMEANNITRSDAAAALGVDERSLSNYRSRGLPRRKHARAEQIMQEHQAAPAIASESNRLAVSFTDDEYDLVQRAAEIVRQPDIREFIRRAATIKAQEDIAKHGTLKVAEDPPEYGKQEGKA
jgi:ParB-like chromosome segregation protein Spo0J